MEEDRPPSILDGSNTVFFGTELSYVSAQKSAIDKYLQNSKRRVKQTKDFCFNAREHNEKKRRNYDACERDTSGNSEGYT